MSPLYREINKLAMEIADLWKSVYDKRANQLKYWR